MIADVMLSSATLFVCGFTLWVAAYTLQTIERFSMSTQESIDAIVAQLGKAQAEVVAKIADVQAQLDAAGVAEQIDLTALSAAAQALDDVVPDLDPAA